MGAGRKTFTYDLNTHEEPVNHNPGYQGFERRQRQLQDDLCGVIFICNHSTLEECQSGLIFGLPAQHWCYVQHILPGTPLFLYNVSDKNLHGIYRAVGPGDWEINPNGWARYKNQKTQFPAQVKVERYFECPPIHEKDFGDIIADNYYLDHKGEKFLQELDKKQVLDLCALYRVRGKQGVPADWPPLPCKEKKEIAEFPPLPKQQQEPITQRRTDNGARPSTVAPIPVVVSAPPPLAAPGGEPEKNQQDMKRSIEGDVVATRSPEVKTVAENAGPRPRGNQSVADKPQPLFGVPVVFAGAGQEAPAPVEQAPPITLADVPGVDDISNELKGLKQTLGPLLRKLKVQVQPSALGTALETHLQRLDEHLTQATEDRLTLLKRAGSAAPSDKDGPRGLI